MDRLSRPGATVCLCWIILLTAGWSAAASDAQLYFSADKNGQNRVTVVQEGDEIWFVVVDNDENVDCDVRDKIDAPVALNDPKTGALGGLGLQGDYLEEIGPDTGVFVSNRTAQIGTRESFAAATPWLHTHVVDQIVDEDFDEFGWGNWLYIGDERGWLVGSAADRVYECVPTLGVMPGDTIVAYYQDPSNHSDNAAIAIKIGIGGGGTPPTQASRTQFVDASGDEVAHYTDADLVYVKVIDPSHTGAALLANAVEIDGETYDLTLVSGDTFMTEGLDLGLAAGASITATYSDPADPTDESSDTITRACSR